MFSICISLSGSSPCVWGTGLMILLLYPFIRFIPMRMGNSPKEGGGIGLTGVHPHAYGEQSKNNYLFIIAIFDSAKCTKFYTELQILLKNIFLVFFLFWQKGH